MAVAGPAGDGTVMAAMAAVAVALGLFLIYFLRANQERLESTVAVTQAAAEVLNDNPSVFFWSLGVIFVYVVYLVLWTAAFTHLLLMGRIEASTFRPSAWCFPLQAAFIGMLLWTTGVFEGVQKWMIGRTVAVWYFHRHDPDYGTTPKGPKAAISDTMRLDSFGAICLSALVMSFVKACRGCLWAVRKTAEQFKEGGVLKSIVLSLHSAFAFIERLVEQVTDFSLFYVALTREPFFTASRSVFTVFRRNLLTAFVSDFTGQVLFTVTGVLVSTCTAAITFLLSQHALHLHASLYTSALFAGLSWFILHFFAGIFSAAIDSAFLCYALDLDTDRVNSVNVHKAFGSKLAVIRRRPSLVAK
jgi:hypothetical protein